MHSTQEPQMEPQPALSRIAPLWHTLLLVGIILGGSFLNVRAQHGAAVFHAAPSHTLIYLLTIGWEWLLLALTYGGIRRAHTPLRQLLGVRRRGAAAWWIDCAIAIGFWFGSSLVLTFFGSLLRFSRLDLGHVRTASCGWLLRRPSNSACGSP